MVGMPTPKVIRYGRGNTFLPGDNRGRVPHQSPSAGASLHVVRPRLTEPSTSEVARPSEVGRGRLQAEALLDELEEGYGDAGSNSSSDDTTYDESPEDVLERDDLVTLRTSLEEGLSRVEHNGADREAAARMLELYADAVREGHVYHALGMQLEHDVHQHINASHGMFVPGQFGTFPEEHSQSGIRPYMGSSLPDVERYDDLFLFRHPDHPWLLDTRPRDGLNAHDIRFQSGMPALAHETIMGRPDGARKQQQTTRWYVNAYLHADDPDVLPLGEDVLDGLQFGGKRNYGYGTTTLKDTQVVDLEAVDYSRLEDGEAFILELVTPFVLRSEYPKANNVDVPWWWSVDDEAQLRHRLEKVIEGGDVYELETVDHGVVVGYDGDRPVETAMSGLTRVGNHSKYGFGELRVKPVTPDETNVKNR